LAKVLRFLMVSKKGRTKRDEGREEAVETISNDRKK
jgi:hypothetical protein